jgi:hypothetical protein
MRRPFSASDVLRLWEGLPPLDDAFRGFLVAHALPAGEPNTPAVVGGLRWLGAPRGICVGEATVHRVDPSRVVDTFRGGSCSVGLSGWGHGGLFRGGVHTHVNLARGVERTRARSERMKVAERELEAAGGALRLAAAAVEAAQATHDRGTASLSPRDDDVPRDKRRSSTTLPVYLLVQNWHDPGAACAACVALSPHRALAAGLRAALHSTGSCTLRLFQSVAAGCVVATLVGGVYAVRPRRLGRPPPARSVTPYPLLTLTRPPLAADRRCTCTRPIPWSRIRSTWCALPSLPSNPLMSST